MFGRWYGLEEGGMSRQHKRYEPDRIHFATLIPYTGTRKCSYCGGKIDVYPSNHDPKYVWFCIQCRWDRILNDQYNYETRGL